MYQPIYENQTVSVIVPIYNSGKYIFKTLQSILDQTYKDIEIICVDDCSCDNSKSIIESLQKQHNNIFYFCQEYNGGASVARNTALDLAHGRYVAFLDSDDLWMPLKLEKQISFMSKNQVSFCYTAIEMMDESDKQIKPKRKIPLAMNYKKLLHNTAIATSSTVIDRNMLGNFKMPLRRSGQDYATWLMLLRNGNVAYGIDEPLVRYRVSNSSLSSNKFKSIKQVWEIQVRDEGIHYLPATWHVICFAIHAAKKYFI